LDGKFLVVLLSEVFISLEPPSYAHIDAVDHGNRCGGTVLFGHNVIVASFLIAIWGMALGVIQLGWTTWLTHTVPNEVESAGGIQISAIQLAIRLARLQAAFSLI